MLAFAGGIFCGLSTITKQNGAVVALAVVLWHFLSNADKLFKRETFLRTVFDKNLILFCSGCFLSACYWFIKVTSTYGDILYRPRHENILETAKTDWFKMVQSRPKHLYLFGVPYQNPLFVLAYISPLWLWLDKGQYKNHIFAVAWLAGAFLLAYNFFTGEHRYFLPAYPAFAMLGAYVANRLRILVDKNMGYRAGTVLFLVALAFSAIWSVSMAFDTLFFDGAEIMRPF